jgi:hypothetical protein
MPNSPLGAAVRLASASCNAIASFQSNAVCSSSHGNCDSTSEAVKYGPSILYTSGMFNFGGCWPGGLPVRQRPMMRSSWFGWLPGGHSPACANPEKCVIDAQWK